MAKKLKITYETLKSLSGGLYSNLPTVLAELISNSWDANARNIRIAIDENKVIISDDGHGMSEKDFENNFLQVGYSRRDSDSPNPDKSKDGKRYVMGRKGIGKLSIIALSKNAIVITKTSEGSITGGIFDAEKMEQESRVTGEYTVEELTDEIKQEYKDKMRKSGTLIVLEGLKSGVWKRDEYIKERLSLYFQVNHLLEDDDSFSIFLNDSEIDPYALYNKAQFLWYFDEETKERFNKFKKNMSLIDEGGFNKLENIFEFEDPKTKEIKEIKVQGFIFSANKTTDLKFQDIDFNVNKISIFSHGRQRVSNVISEITNERIVQNYLVGVIHVDGLDEGDTDRFTTNREGIFEYDPLYEALILFLKDVLRKISLQWDKNRKKIKGESSTASPEEKYYSTVVSGLVKQAFRGNRIKQENILTSPEIDSLITEGVFSQKGYTLLFFLENLLRKRIEPCAGVLLKGNTGLVKKILSRKKKEEQSRGGTNISFPIRIYKHDVDYIDIGYLLSLYLKKIREQDNYPDKELNEIHENFLNDFKQDEKNIIAIRNAVMHSALITKDAKTKLETDINNIFSKILKTKREN